MMTGHVPRDRHRGETATVDAFTPTRRGYQADDALLESPVKGVDVMMIQVRRSTR